MMGGFGVTDFMKKSMERNKALLGNKKSLKELNDEAGYPKKSYRKLVFRRSTPQRIADLREKLIEENRRSDLIRISIFFLLSLSIGFTIYWIFFK